MADGHQDMQRFVVFANSQNEIDLHQYKILDSKNHLFLLSDKNAKIWEN
jgi:hypothetical protein